MIFKNDYWVQLFDVQRDGTSWFECPFCNGLVYLKKGNGFGTCCDCKSWFQISKGPSFKLNPWGAFPDLVKVCVGERGKWVDDMEDFFLENKKLNEIFRKRGEKK